MFTEGRGWGHVWRGSGCQGLGRGARPDPGLACGRGAWGTQGSCAEADCPATCGTGTGPRHRTFCTASGAGVGLRAASEAHSHLGAPRACAGHSQDLSLVPQARPRSRHTARPVGDPWRPSLRCLHLAFPAASLTPGLGHLRLTAQLVCCFLSLECLSLLAAMAEPFNFHLYFVLCVPPPIKGSLLSPRSLSSSKTPPLFTGEHENQLLYTLSLKNILLHSRFTFGPLALPAPRHPPA